ncbi:MAG: RNA-binding protein [Planctomycetes bacterium]|nr:RNA-binding protein [Planctomycetota bacterium]
MNHKLHVGNLASDMTSDQLGELFGRDGRNVARVSLVMSRDAGVSRGFAFVEMASDEDANRAVAALHGTEVAGRTLRVTVAHPPKSRFGGRVARI